MIGVRYDVLYKLIGRSTHDLVHDDTHLSEIWHRIFSHLHCRAFPFLRKRVIGFLELQIEHDGVCKGCALGKLANRSFPNSERKSKRDFGFGPFRFMWNDVSCLIGRILVLGRLFLEELDLLLEVQGL